MPALCKMNADEKKIFSLVSRAIYQYKLIEDQDHVLVAVSGGKDSLTLLHDLIQRQKRFPIQFKITAAHIRTDFCTCCKESKLESVFKEWGVAYRIVDVPVIARLKPGRTMNCYWCSSQRRLELMRLAEELGCNKIALGHHLDDIIETYFMNICFKGEVSTMLPFFRYDRYPQIVIRPLALVEESLIIRFIQSIGISQVVCQCPYGQKSKRREVRDAIRLLAANNKNVRENIFRSMTNIRDRYMIQE